MNLLKNTTFIESLNKMNEINVNGTEKDLYLKSIFEKNLLMNHIKSEHQMIVNKQIFDDLEHIKQITNNVSRNNRQEHSICVWS